MLEEELAEEGGVLVLNGDEPGKDDGEVEGDAGPPDGLGEDPPLAAEHGKGADDDENEEGRDGALGEGSDCGEEVDIDEPELGAGFVPCVPAEHSDGKGRGELHVRGCAAGEAEDADAGSRDECGVKVATATETAHVEIGEADQPESEADGGQAGDPVMDAELTKGVHGAPVVEGWFFEPGFAVEVGGDAGGKLFAEGVGLCELDEHFVGDLRVTWFIRADQTQAGPAEDGGGAVEDKENHEDEQGEDFPHECSGRQVPGSGSLNGWGRICQGSLHWMLSQGLILRCLTQFNASRRLVRSWIEWA